MFLCLKTHVKCLSLVPTQFSQLLSGQQVGCGGDGGAPQGGRPCLCEAECPLLGTCPQKWEEAAGLCACWLREHAVGRVGICVYGEPCTWD